jgi:DNA-binding MarR family transcriptional regulator
MSLDEVSDREVEEAANGFSNRCFGHNFRSIDRLITRYYSRCIEGSEIVSTQFSMMMLILSMKVPMRNIDLASLFNVDKTTVTRNLSILLNRKLVLDSEEGKLSISPEGMQALKKALPLWKEAQGKVYEIVKSADAIRDYGLRLAFMVEALNKLMKKPQP